MVQDLRDIYNELCSDFNSFDTPFESLGPDVLFSLYAEQFFRASLKEKLELYKSFPDWVKERLEANNKKRRADYNAFPNEAKQGFPNSISPEGPLSDDEFNGYIEFQRSHLGQSSEDTVANCHKSVDPESVEAIAFYNKVKTIFIDKVSKILTGDDFCPFLDRQVDVLKSLNSVDFYINEYLLYEDFCYWSPNAVEVFTPNFKAIKFPNVAKFLGDLSFAERYALNSCLLDIYNYVSSSKDFCLFVTTLIGLVDSELFNLFLREYNNIG